MSGGEPPSSEPSSPGRPPRAGVDVVVADEQTDHPIDPARWARLAAHVLHRHGIHRGELVLSFVDEPTIAELNVTHMGHDGPTDVLAFPLDADDTDDADHAGASASADMPSLLGDVVICPAVAAANAELHAAGGAEPHPGHPDHDGTLASELALLVVHGTLHVLGHDHAEPEETAAMHAAEREVLTALDQVDAHTASHEVGS